jgi:hypothetical protein
MMETAGVRGQNARPPDGASAAGASEIQPGYALNVDQTAKVQLNIGGAKLIRNEIKGGFSYRIQIEDCT